MRVLIDSVGQHAALQVLQVGQVDAAARRQRARARAQREVGDHPTIGHGYAVSQDGITKIEVDGTTIGDLFDGPTTDNDFRRTADGQIFPRTDRGLAELRALHDEQCRRDAETAYDARDY